MTRQLLDNPPQYRAEMRLEIQRPQGIWKLNFYPNNTWQSEPWIWPINIYTTTYFKIHSRVILCQKSWFHRWVRIWFPRYLGREIDFFYLSFWMRFDTLKVYVRNIQILQPLYWVFLSVLTAPMTAKSQSIAETYPQLELSSLKGPNGHIRSVWEWCHCKDLV